ncbi:hypothetical protein QQ054_30560 [Oscillatoria amoena NRMC-F 0135]|uniref:Alpha-glucosidase n=1 Tax=Geitlerinema calcuttense NRMC-F 0142 TaxID=2922238 RepID=A0ABT7LX57_9CYAN|nr:hypothetical protein [Geitlerinema calcuttense]MDL5050348.1 hypothetical protein [Oscillatoria amoena NRMC-F 0135]MDL5056599.1 hypothetical protein [Geitlerinema calcuttense NRMC-F 0142]
MSTSTPLIRFDHLSITPVIEDSFLKSIGQVTICDIPLRNPQNRFLPWFDTYEGEVFRSFRFDGIDQSEKRITLKTTAISDPDTIFRERRDSSGDLVFKDKSWDSDPLEIPLHLVFEAVDPVVFEGHTFHGFKYHFEFLSPHVKIHRFLDRQTWEIGGNLDDLSICIRNWSHPPRVKLSKDGVFSTGGLVEQFAVAFPGNLWGRWSLLPAYDFQYGSKGCLLAWFDHVSLIRSLVESNKGEDWVRHLDFHFFKQTTTHATNPKTILFCADDLDDVTAANVWTRVFDQEKTKARAQFGMKEEEDVKVNFDQNNWVGFHFDTSYEKLLETAAEFDAEYIFIDPVWENEQSIQEELNKLIPEETQRDAGLKNFQFGNMCSTTEWRVPAIRGGEEALKGLCDRASAKGVRVISWIGSHFTTRGTYERDQKMGKGYGGIYAVKESGRRAAYDTGYFECAPLNWNTPMYEYSREKILGICRRTGLGGFLWDSYSNLGWWHVDYGNDLDVQFDKHAQLYADFSNEGLYLRPEAIVAFSNHSSLCMIGDYYQPGLESTYGYQSCIGLHEKEEFEILRGQKSVDKLFDWVANKHIPPLHFQLVPREEWNADNVALIKQLFKAYRENVVFMKKRTILPDIRGIQWDAPCSTRLVFALQDFEAAGAGWTDVFSGEQCGTSFQKNRLYKSKA